MNKKVFLIIFGISISFIFSSCFKEEDDYFEDSASVRIEKEMIKFQELLVKPQEGWVMEYYPGGKNITYGGFALIAKFTKDGIVSIQSVLNENVSEVATSFYSLKKDAGATLNFDTYNSFFHYFSDPDVIAGGGRGKGYLGDYEFLFKESTEGMILIEGKKHGSKIYMHALKSSGTEYLKKAKSQMLVYEESINDKISAYTVSGTLNDKPVEGVFNSSQQLSLTQEDSQGIASFMFTEEGVKLYEPVVLNGYTLMDLSYDPEADVLFSADGKTRLKLDKDLVLGSFMGDYTFSSTNYVAEVNIDITNERKIIMTGLPFLVTMTYIKDAGVLEIRSQKLIAEKNVYLAAWNTISGNLNWGTSQGLVLKRLDDSNKIVYQLVTNGSSLQANALILWQVGAGEYKDYGISRLTDITLTKK